ncbi:hypothetical protein ACWOFR_00175 [Carnobacterium gallinarum]|uniref:hypothetical protein n=1 Tax=Carnobacterium gallinarum TaxID=2749 RepID=UPI000552E822|nr:hypothetical protein [Carnobacterium gallinarum]
MENINKFINEWEKSSKQIHSEHIDFFIGKETFNYEDCLEIMKIMKKELRKRGLDTLKVMIRIQCGQSKKVQNWGELFWQLVDANLTPPEIFISKEEFFDSSEFRQSITRLNQVDNIENYSVFYPVEDGFIRCLDVVEKEVRHG